MEMNEIKNIVKALSECKKNGKTSYTFALAEDKTEELSVGAMNETLRKELFELCGTRTGYERHKLDLFDLIQESIDAKVPAELAHFFDGFTTVQQFGPKDEPEFTLRKDKKNLRARKFAVLGASAGSYEVFRLAKENKIRINVTAVTDACQISFEDFLSGRVDWNEMLDAIQMGMEDRVYDEVLKCLAVVEAKLPQANKASSTNFDPAGLEKVMGTIAVYGAPTIFCTETFARQITEGYSWASDAEKLARRNVGYLANYKGAKIVILPQSFTDETNTTKVTDDSKAYVMPAGAGSIFYIALQGDTQVRDIDSNEDWSIELQTYKRFGVAALVYNDLGTVEITSLK